MEALYAIGAIVFFIVLSSILFLHTNKQRENTWNKIMYNKNKKND